MESIKSVSNLKFSNHKMKLQNIIDNFTLKIKKQWDHIEKYILQENIGDVIWEREMSKKLKYMNIY